MSQRSHCTPSGSHSWSPSVEERSLLFDADRLAALREASLLDVPAPDDLQRVVDLLARQLQAPMATLSVVDADRQFFLASTGLPAPLAMARQTPLPGAICKHVLFDAAPVVISDVRGDARFASHEAIELTGMGCYLGTPITTGDGTRIGALCVMAREAREWTDDDVRTVQDFAAVATALIEARYMRVRERQERSEKLDILTRITEGFVTFDRDWRVKFVNATAAALTRRTPEEATGRVLWELLPAIENSEIGCWLRSIQSTPGIYERE